MTSTPRLAHGHPSNLDYHRRLLDDLPRVSAYDRALRALVRPGDVVLDLGAGSGLLSMLAARRGAARVHAVESMDVAALASRLVADNGLDHIVTVHRADFLEMEPVEPVDLVVSDFMGRFVVDDGMLQTVERARAWMKEGARFCPASLDMKLAPVGDIFLRAVDLFEEPFMGLDLTGALPCALNYCYVGNLPPQVAMAEAQTYATLTPPAPTPDMDAALTFEIARGGRLQALAGYFEAHLAEDVLLTTAPGVETHWGQYLFPLPPTPVELGDRLEFRLHLTPDGDDEVWRWAGAVRRGDDTLANFDLESVQRLGERPREA